MLKNSVKPDYVWLVDDKPIKKFLEMESKIMK
jgi:hypothetical protein